MLSFHRILVYHEVKNAHWVSKMDSNYSTCQAGEGVKLEETQAPPFVAAMEGKTYIFQVRVSSYNFKANHQTLTISWCKTGRGEAFKKGGC